MAIYLVDYENVYIEGLSGIDQLTEQDALHIFYTQNRCGLTFGLYEQLLQCRAKVELNEVSTGPKNADPVKNALDIQLMMFAGYLIGTRQDTSLYIVSKDKDFQLGTDFLEHYLGENGVGLEIVPSVAASLTVAESPETQEAPEEPAAPEAQEAPAAPAAPPEPYQAFVQSIQAETRRRSPRESFAVLCDRYAKPVPAEEFQPVAAPLSSAVLSAAPESAQTGMYDVQYHNTVRNLLGKSTDEETITVMCELISSSEDLLAFNNALARYYRDGQRAKVVYHKIKPRFENLRHLSRACTRKG